jgi:hypothetical protein
LGVKRAIFRCRYCASSYVFSSITPTESRRFARAVGAMCWGKVVIISDWTNFLPFAQKLCHDVTMS